MNDPSQNLPLSSRKHQKTAARQEGQPGFDLDAVYTVLINAYARSLEKDRKVEKEVQNE